eukprot:Clim_evm8s81 gene=Clim_evmTU8s81
MLSTDETLDVLKATFTLVTTSIGAGILSIPYGFATLGWWTFAIIFIVSILMLIGALYLNEALKVSKSFTYVALAEEHLGPIGKFVLQLALVFNTYFVAIIYVILAASSFQAVFANVTDLDYIIWVVITVIAMWPIGMLPEVKDMAPMLVFAAICSYGVAIVILIEAGQDVGDPIEFETPESVSLSMGINAVSTFIFAYTFAVLIPNTRRNMKYPKNMHYPIILVVLCLLTIYALVGSINHAAYGCEIPSNILTKYDRNIPWYIANLLLAGHMLVAAPLLLNPFVITIESFLLKIEISYTQAVAESGAVDTARSADVESDVAVVEPSKAEMGASKFEASKFEAEIDKLPVNAAHEERLYGSAKNEMDGNWFHRNRFGLGRIVLRTIVWASILFVALLIPFFGSLEEAVVGLALTVQTMVGPMVIYWAINRNTLTLQWKVTFGLIVAVLVVFAGFATYYSIHDIVEAASSFRVFHVTPDSGDLLCPI